ncbi:hypothetical protein D3C72_569270 [compost metagenome]
MNEIGILWQTGTITPSHEHFISYLIRQKLLSSIEQLQILEPAKKDKVFILYLPQNEIHELGLIYLNYEILFHGYKTIYLGQSIPIENLKDLTNLFDTTIFVSYWTVFPEVEETASYIKTVQEEILTDKKSELWILGKLAKHIPAQNLNSQISVYFSMQEALNKL